MEKNRKSRTLRSLVQTTPRRQPRRLLRPGQRRPNRHTTISASGQYCRDARVYHRRRRNACVSPGRIRHHSGPARLVRPAIRARCLRCRIGGDLERCPFVRRRQAGTDGTGESGTRGASGSEPDSGDGAGILIQVPDALLRRVSGIELPEPGAYATGIGFFPQTVLRATR